jgi:tetratricopeptide (TPR) repeat protein
MGGALRSAAVCLTLGFAVCGNGIEAWAQAGAPTARIRPEELSDPKALEQRADLYMVRKYFPEAIEIYKRLTELQPKNAVFQNKMGIAYHQLGNFSAAKTAYRKAVQLNPQYAEAMNNLGAVEYAEKNYRAAILTYLKALALQPGDAVMYSNLGTAYFSYERYEYAMTSYRYAISLDPKIFERSGRAGTIVHQRDPKNTAAFDFYMAKTYASLSNVEETLRYLNKAWEEGFPDFRKSLNDKDFAFLISEPGFIELLAKIEASEQNPQNAGAANPGQRSP